MYGGVRRVAPTVIGAEGIASVTGTAKMIGSPCLTHKLMPVLGHEGLPHRTQLHQRAGNCGAVGANYFFTKTVMVELDG